MKTRPRYLKKGQRGEEEQEQKRKEEEQRQKEEKAHTRKEGKQKEGEEQKRKAEEQREEAQAEVNKGGRRRGSRSARSQGDNGGVTLSTQAVQVKLASVRLPLEA